MKYDSVPEMHFSGYVNKEWHENIVPHNSCNHDFFYKIQKYRQIMCKTGSNSCQKDTHHYYIMSYYGNMKMKEFLF